MSFSVTMFVRNDLQNDSRVWKEAHTLLGAGWSVRIIGVTSPGTVPREKRDGIDVVRVPIRPIDTLLAKRWLGAVDLNFTHAAQGPGSTAPVAVGRRGRWISALRRRWAPFHEELATLEYSRKALAVAQEKPADVYHAHDLNAIRPAMSARRLLGGKVVFDAHEFYSERNFYRAPGPWEHRRLRKEEALACRSADLCITVSDGIADELTRRYGLSRRPSVIMNCPVVRPVPLPVTALADKLGIQGKVVLYIGLVTFHRGIEQTMRALTFDKRLHLALLGPVQRGYRAALDAVAASAGVAERVHFLGAVAPGDVAATAAGADVAVALIQNACLSYYYCSPNKLFEALAAGLPVVASNFPDLGKVLGNKGIGVVCRPDDPTAIAAALQEVLAWPRENVRNAALLAANDHSWEKEGRKMTELYEQLKEQK